MIAATVHAVTADIETLAQALARSAPADLDRLIAGHVAEAVREHRIDEAVRWQRVRLRARALQRRGGTGPLSLPTAQSA